MFNSTELSTAVKYGINMVAFRFRWFDCTIGAAGRFWRCPSGGLLYQLEPELEQELPVRLRQALPGRGTFIRRNVRIAQLAMRRHHAYRRSIMTGYGAVALWIPVGQRWARRVAALTGGPRNTGVEKPCVRACAICRRGKRSSIPRRGWNGRTGSIGVGNGRERYGMVAPRLIDTPPKAWPDQPNHLNSNAAPRYHGFCRPVLVSDILARQPHRRRTHD